MSRQSEAIKSSPKGAGRPVGSNRQASLARILPAARKLFAENGYTKTTLKDVGKEAGMTHAALYSYFPSKAALYEATCEDAQAILLAEYTEAIALGTTLRDQLGQILRAGAQAHDRDSSITGLLGAIPLEIRRHPELAELLLDRQNLTLQFLSGAFRQAQQRGEINSSASPEEQVVVIMGAAVGIALLQHGLEHTSLVHSMEIFIELIEARLFITTS